MNKNYIKIFFAILVILFGIGIAQAAENITSCGTIAVSGNYELNQNISGTGTCLSISASNVEIDCKGNTITYNTAGGSTLMGIDAISGTNQRTNVSIMNCIIVKPTSLQTAGYGIRLTRLSNSRIVNNTIYTNGTTNNYGIFVTTNSERVSIENNTVYSYGTSTGNTGIYVTTNSTNSSIKNNIIRTFGSASAYGVWISTDSHNSRIEYNNIETLNNATSNTYGYGIYVTTRVNGTIISENNISTSGTANNNFGIYLQNDIHKSNVSQNKIYTNGTTANYGIYLFGTAALQVNNNIIHNNEISTRGTTTNNFGIYLLTGANRNSIRNNTIKTFGTGTNHGVYISGTTSQSSNNEITDNNISADGTGASNYGIHLYRNSNNNNVTNNYVVTNGTTGNYGIYGVGTTALPVNDNIIHNNTVRAGGVSSNYGIFVSTLANNNNITDNDVETRGTTTNYGIYLLGTTALNSDSNIVSRNRVQPVGTTTNNYGVVISTNAKNNKIVENNISTMGTTGSHGIYITAANNNEVEFNEIFANGNDPAVSRNYGIYLYRNVSYTKIYGNNITVIGTDTLYGIHGIGTTALPVNDTVIKQNNITVIGKVGGNNYGIYLSTLANNNNITDNEISTNGTTGNYGVYILGTAALASNGNIIFNNTIKPVGTTTNNYGIRISTNTNDNLVKQNIIGTRGTSGNIGIYISGATTALSNNNNLTDNIIETIGTTTDNYGIHLVTNTNNNVVKNNTIKTFGTTLNHGVYLSGTTFQANNNEISYNNISTDGTGASNYGIYLYRNISYNNVSRNIISTRGTTTNHGIYGVGAATYIVHHNIIDNNKITTSGTALANTHYGIWLSSNIENNTISNNEIDTSGTTGNYGVYLLGALNSVANNNLISENTIQSVGTTTNNYGIYLLTNANNNKIINNKVSAYGTTGTIGIAMSGLTRPSNYNTVENNNITSNGTATSNGIYITANVSEINVTNNNISVKGTNTSNGVYLLGTAGNPITNNEIRNNSISAECYSSYSNCNGVYLQNLISQNRISYNNIWAAGNINNTGIYLFGTTPLPVQENLISYNKIDTLNGDRIRINAGSIGNIISNNNIDYNNDGTYDINIISVQNTATNLIDQNIQSFNFAGTSEGLTVRKQEVGMIEFSGGVGGSRGNLSNAVIISHNYVYVNASISGLNKSAIVTLNNLSFEYPTVFRDGKACSDCNIISNENGTISFSVPHFSSYTIGENSQLSIFDDSDLGDFYGGALKFYANYTNVSSNSAITSANCSLAVDNNIYEMQYNLATELYEYSINLFSPGTEEYSINCSSSNFATLQTNDTYSVQSGDVNKLPKGAKVEVVKSERASDSAPTKDYARAGNVTWVDISAYTITSSWQGYYGNVSGVVQLADSTNNVMYNWTLIAPKGEIYASRAANINFATARCANNAEVAAEESFIGHSPSQVDSVTNTFSGQNHPGFYVGQIQINDNSCKSMNTFDLGGMQSNKFYNVLLSDAGSNMIYTSILEQDANGFDSRTHDFQMIVGENGNQNSTGTTPYYFYVEIY